ncbi:hypothetical protein M9Y10_039306 [Tritrichomonas musculus]|uniref:DUF3447 domain-containing protein n=1 Tax=Tritrichomonas musculus TaxID=1915356 RepID=A0ABR2KBG9_9EUKA
MESYITDHKKLYTAILEFLENSDENFDDTANDGYILDIQQQVKDEDHGNMEEFLRIVKNINDHHHRDTNFITRTKQLLLYYKSQIKQTLSNEEIFDIFKDNKLLVHFLLTNDIIRMTDTISEKMMYIQESNGNRYCHFFYPELEHFLGKEKMEYVKNELLNNPSNVFHNYDLKRQEGENDSQILSMIRNDSVEEFISYVTRSNHSLSSKITPSIFETNSFLIENKNTTLIEYSAFFGSIQIFQYLMINEVKLTPSLWLYAIHSNNAELIHMLETSNVIPPKFENKSEIEFNGPDNEYLRCLTESIKCHHNDFADYFDNNFVFQEKKDPKRIKAIIYNCIKYHNYCYFETATIEEHGFFYLSLYRYKELFNLLLKEKENKIQLRIISNLKYFNEGLISTTTI